MSYMQMQLTAKQGFKTADEVEDKATTVRPSSTSLFCIESSDRYNSVIAQQFGIISPYNFNIQKNESLLNGFFSRIGLTEIVFPYYIPNINNQTNTIKMIYNGGPEVTVTLTNGFYTPTALAAALQAALIIAGAGAGTTVIYNSLGQFVIDVQAGNDIILFDATNAPYGISLFDLLGGTNDWINPGGQILTGRVTRCRFTEYVDIVCSQLTYNQDLKDGSSDPVVRDMIARVYIETENDQPIPVNVIAGTNTSVVNTVPGTYPFTIYRQFKTPKMIKWNKTQPIGNLRFEVYDCRGNLLTMAGAMDDWLAPDWRMTLLVSEN
jgi:hypothetical protein